MQILPRQLQIQHGFVRIDKTELPILIVQNTLPYKCIKYFASHDWYIHNLKDTEQRNIKRIGSIPEQELDITQRTLIFSRPNPYCMYQATVYLSPKYKAKCQDLQETFGITLTDYFRSVVYQRYQMNWMQHRNYDLQDLIASVTEYQRNSFTTNLNEIIQEWETNYGFHGNIWACYDEFLHTEYMDEMYVIEELLNSNKREVDFYKKDKITFE